MELKKSVKADLEWRKPMFIQIGLVISLLIVYMAFEFVGARESDGDVFLGGTIGEEEEKVIQTEQPKDLPPTPPPPMVESLIDIISDDIKVADFIIDVESNQDLITEEYIAPIEEKQEVVKEAEIFVVVEVLPEYTGGEEARLKFLRDNIVYPKVARETGMEGKVIIAFVVEPDGRLSHFEVVRGAAPALDEEALRVAKLMPKWKAGKQRGKEVRVRYTMPITFTLN